MATRAVGAASYERETIPDDGYRTALGALLVCHAVAGWNVDQRAAYAEHTMDGPSLDHWVRTTNVWAELERRVWEFDNLAASAGITDPARAIAEAWGDVPSRVAAAEEDWLGLLFSMCYLDGVGHLLVDGCRTSSYGPLLRTARLAANGKWGVVASGLVGLEEVVRLAQETREELASRRDAWVGLTSDLLQAVGAQLAAIDASCALAEPIDVTSALETVDARVRARLEAKP